MVKLLDCPKLAHLTSHYLTEKDLGERVIDARVEAYSCKRAGCDKQLSKRLEKQYQDELITTPAQFSPAQFSPAPIGSLTDTSTRKLLIDLVCTMNASFPDYDFSSIHPEQFTKELHPQLVINSINNLLVDPLDKIHVGFRRQLWDAIGEIIDLPNCDIFSYVPDLEADLFSLDSFTCYSFNYFFFCKKQKKILYFTCEAKSKLKKMDDSFSCLPTSSPSDEFEFDMEIDDE